MMAAGTSTADRTLEAARQLRAVAEETRLLLQTAREIVQRSRTQQEDGDAVSNNPPSVRPDDPGPSSELVECLVEAFNLADADGDAHTRSLVYDALYFVGHRAAVTLGPKATGVVVH